MSDLSDYQAGATVLHVGLSATLEVAPLRGMSRGFFKINSGAGTLAIVHGASSIYSQGYLVGATEKVEFWGPCRFFLAAAGATMVVGFVPIFSSGYSLYP